MIRPLGDYLVLQPFGKKPGMVGLLHMPDTGTLATATGCLCRVLAAGPKADQVKAGDVVHLKAYGAHPAGLKVLHEGKALVMIRQRDINGVVTNYKPTDADKPWETRADWDIEPRLEEDPPEEKV